jgi:hypothetical protein
MAGPRLVHGDRLPTGHRLHPRRRPHQGNDEPEAFLFDGTHEPLRIGVQIWAPRRQPHQLHPGGQEAHELPREKRVSIDNQMTKAPERTGHGVGQIAGDLRHPTPISPAGDARDVNAARPEKTVPGSAPGPASEHLDAEEVRGCNRAPVGLQKRLPRHRFSSQRSGFEAVFLEQTLNRRTSKVQPQVAEHSARCARLCPG